ncbi:MAG: HD domain-containing phosphohydrolase [Nitrospinales bacterium]
MKKLKEYIFANFEGFFVLLILLSAVLINYFIYAKMAFLNFYYMPVMIAAYYLDKRKTILGAFFIVLMVWIYVLVNEEGFLVSSSGVFDLYFNLSIWGCFLILAGLLVGTLSEKLRVQLEESNRLRESLRKEEEALKLSNERLSDYTANLEQKISERTQDLERSHTLIESLKEKVENALYSVMDATVARMMIEGKLRNEKRQISILFSDLKDFTSYSEKNPPEKVVGELNSYLNCMEEALLGYYGHIDKYMGDGIMAEFGAPIGYHMHPLMAVLAGLSMQKKLPKLFPTWKMRIGIATGPAVLGLFGSKRKGYSCIGNSANLASRLEAICDPGSVYIDEVTYNAVKPYVQAIRIYDLVGNRASDADAPDETSALLHKLEKTPNDAETLFALGQIYFKRRQATRAIEYFEKTLKINPEHTQAKLAFAEANIKRNEFEKIALKGKKDRVAVYKATGLIDPMENREKIPKCFYDQYNPVADKIDIPQEVILPVEVLDGNILHSKIVAIVAFAIADKLGLSDKDKENILIAGFLHDIGKEIVPHEILQRTEKLNADDMEKFKKHPTESVRIMKKMGYHSESILEMVETHHEHYDGSGYPKGLKGEDIPIGGRILSVADTFDTMTSKRIYAETWEYKSAFLEIQKDASNGQYDIQCVEILKELLGI